MRIIILFLLVCWCMIVFFAVNPVFRPVYNFNPAKLKMRDGTKLHIPGECESDSDCQGDLICTGNVCTLDSDNIDISNMCDESKGCYTLLIALDGLGVPIVECLPTQSQLYFGSDCQIKNDYNCHNGTIDSSFECIPDNGYVALTYDTYAGAQSIPYTLPDNNIVSLLREKNNNVFR